MIFFQILWVYEMLQIVKCAFTLLCAKLFWGKHHIVWFFSTFPSSCCFLSTSSCCFSLAFSCYFSFCFSLFSFLFLDSYFSYLILSLSFITHQFLWCRVMTSGSLFILARIESMRLLLNQHPENLIPPQHQSFVDHICMRCAMGE